MIAPLQENRGARASDTSTDALHDCERKLIGCAIEYRVEFIQVLGYDILCGGLA